MPDLRKALKTAIAPSDLEERERQARHHQQLAAPAPAQPLEPARKPAELQGAFLNAHRGKAVVVYLISGIRLSGILKSFDQYCLLIEHEGAQQLVFKHAVSTVGPDTGRPAPGPGRWQTTGERRAARTVEHQEPA